MRASWIVMAVLLLAGCKGKKEAAQTGAASAAGMDSIRVVPPSAPASSMGAAAHLVVYRTRTDLREQVPIAIAADGQVLSYPHPADLLVAGHLALPTDLGDGWLLDNRGVGRHTAFLKMTYAEYAGLDEAPTLAELKEAIMDSDPLTDLCDCGPRTSFTDPAAELARIIRNDSLELRCKRLK